MKFDWKNAVERAAWTAIQVPAAIAVVEAAAGGISLDRQLVMAGLVGFALSFAKTYGQERVEWLAAKRANR